MISRLEFLLALPGLGFLARFFPRCEGCGARWDGARVGFKLCDACDEADFREALAEWNCPLDQLEDGTVVTYHEAPVWTPVRRESVTVTHPELAALYGWPEVQQGDRSWATIEEYEAEMGPLFG